MRTVLIDVEEVRHETSLAFLFVIDGEEVWVPKSVIGEPEDIAVEEEEIEVEVAEWWASKEGLV